MSKDLFQTILAAKLPEDVFGKLAGNDAAERIRELTKQYRMASGRVHPDHHANSKRSTEAFTRLNGLRSEAEIRITAAVYGTAKPTPSTTAASPTVITRKQAKYVVYEALGVGDLCALHRATRIAVDGERDVFLKVTGAPGNNDLVEHEAKLLATLVPKGTPDEKFYRYLPRLIETFKLPQPGGPRQANVFEFLDGYYSLAQIQAAYPDGLVFEDVVWMFNRMLEGIGFVHSQGIVHGAIVPAHVLILPKAHAARFVDWSYAVDKTDRWVIKAISEPYRAFYPPEVLRKEPAYPTADIYMIAKCALFLAGKTPLPDYFKRFLDTCLFPLGSRRPQNAWALRDDFEQVMKTHYGKRRYHPFTMPGA